MFMEPASNVSVPFTVVMRTRSNVADNAPVPAETATCPPTESFMPPFEAQTFVEEFINVSSTFPDQNDAAELLCVAA